MKKNYVMCIVFIAMLLVFACKNSPKNDGELQGNAVSFDSFTPRSISVKNNTGERLVAFKGAIELSSLISGIPANASNHGLRMDPNLFSETGDFALLLVREKDFNENKNNLSAIQNSPFASVYAFYNKSGSNDLVYTISSRSGGVAKLTLHNNSPFNVEIRCNSPEGEVLGYVGAYTANTVLNVNAGDYTLYPLFKKYLARDNEIYSIIPKFQKTKKPFARDFAIASSATWNVGDLWDASTLQLSSGGFYITINNQSNTAVRFKKGDDEYETSLGMKGIASGAQATFFVSFTKNADGSYPDSFKMSTLTIGSALHPNLIPEFEYQLDQKYTITVKGNQQDDLTIEAIQDMGKVNINGIFGL